MANVEKTANGKYRVRWREGGRNRAKVIGSRKDALIYKAELERGQRMGTLVHLEMGQDFFGDHTSGFVKEWWQNFALRKAPKTQTGYASTIDCHLVPRWGNYRLGQITAQEVEGWLAEMIHDGVGEVAQQKAAAMLTQILNAAVRWGKLATNPAALVEKPKHKAEPVRPPAPSDVEAVRERLIAAGRPGDAVLVTVMAYSGLRPQEVLALRWDDIRDRTLMVSHEHKTGYRSVDLWAPVKADLAQWRLASGATTRLVFPTRKGQPWNPENWSNWRSRVWSKHGLKQPPKDLRHTFCSLMIREDKLSIIEQADQAGHSVQVHLDTYSHLFSELKGKGSAEDAIRAARQRVRHADAQEAR